MKRLTSDDRERMMRSRALPENFDTTQALHSPLQDYPRMGVQMVSPTSCPPNYAEVGRPAPAPAYASPATETGYPPIGYRTSQLSPGAASEPSHLDYIPDPRGSYSTAPSPLDTPEVPADYYPSPVSQPALQLYTGPLPIGSTAGTGVSSITAPHSAVYSDFGDYQYATGAAPMAQPSPLPRVVSQGSPTPMQMGQYGGYSNVPAWQKPS